MHFRLLLWIKTHCLRCAQTMLNHSHFFVAYKNFLTWQLDEDHNVSCKEDSITELLLSFKFNQQTRLSKLLEIFFHEGPEIQATVLAGQRIPVPLSKDRVRQRQFNQAQLLAKKI